MRITRSSRGRKLGKKRIGERRLARAGAAGDQDVPPLDDRQRERAAVSAAMIPSRHIIGKRVDPRGGLADREAGRGRRPAEAALEPLAGALAVRRELGADDRRVAVHFGAGMARDQPDDPLGLGRVRADAGVAAARRRAGRAGARRRD